MILGAIFDRFVAKSPVSVMVRGAIEFAFNADLIDDLFDKNAGQQYVRTLLFSSVVDLVSQVVCGIHKSTHAAYQANKEAIGVSVTAVYDKLKGVEPAVSAELVRGSAQRLGDVVRELGGTLPDWVPGYQTRILDGNHLAATEHRLAETRGTSAGPLPGQVLAILDPSVMMVCDVHLCEDGHAQERSLLDDVLARVRPRELYLADRNFCTRGFLLGLVRAGAFFAIREHANLPWLDAGKVYARGRTEGGRVREQRIAVVDDEGVPTYLRRVTLTLDQATRDGETVVVVLTKLPKKDATAGAVAQLYRRRWTIEEAFQELAQALNAEIAGLCFPCAALFAFCLGLVAYNVLGVVKGALRAEHGVDKTEEVSTYYLADEIGGTRRGMMIAIPEEEWAVFGSMTVAEFAAVLRQLASNVRMARFQRHRRGPKKPPVKRVHDPKKPHVSTARILEHRKKAQKTAKMDNTQSP